MIASPAYGAHVCLRCQLRISRPRIPIRVTSSARSRVPRGSRQLHNEAAEDTPQEGDEAGNITITREPVASSKLENRRTLNPKRLSHYPLGRLYGFRGYELREQRQRLKMRTLGAASEVIVLRPSGLVYEPAPEMEELGAEKIDIMARVNAERGLPSQTEINANLDEIRPKSSILSSEEFKLVEDQLNTGFTVAQLSDYVKRFRKIELDTKDVGDKLSAKGMMWTLGWMPGLSDSESSFDEDLLRGYVSAAHTAKQRAVLHLLRQCWNIQIAEVVESLGEIELHLSRQKLELLLSKSEPTHPAFLSDVT
jgi:hypothetical protein